MENSLNGADTVLEGIWIEIIFLHLRFFYFFLFFFINPAPLALFMGHE